MLSRSRLYSCEVFSYMVPGAKRFPQLKAACSLLGRHHTDDHIKSTIVFRSVPNLTEKYLRLGNKGTWHLPSGAEGRNSLRFRISRPTPRPSIYPRPVDLLSNSPQEADTFLLYSRRTIGIFPDLHLRFLPENSSSLQIPLKI